MTRFFVTAIGTDSGKTVFSSILTKALGAYYWKPIQAGTSPATDTNTVQMLAQLDQEHIIPERYLLNTPASPHAAAKIDNIQLSVDEIKTPNVTPLVIEGAGGLFVPINDHEYVIDLIKHIGAPIMLVCNLYLGSINHSILSIRAIKEANIKLAGIIFNGPTTPESERIILKEAEAPCLLHIHPHESITPSIIESYATILKTNLIEHGYINK